jgi:hypothetical protein
MSHLKKGPKRVVSEKENKSELTYWNFVAIDGIIKNQLYYTSVTGDKAAGAWYWLLTSN